MGEDAGAVTWRNAMKKAEEWHPINATNREEARTHVIGYGAWDRETVDGWDDTELGALVLQFAAGEIREAELAGVMDADDYRHACEIGQVSGRLLIDDLGMTVHYDLSN